MRSLRENSEESPQYFKPSLKFPQCLNLFCYGNTGVSKLGPADCFVNAVLLEHSPAIFVSILSMAAFALQGQSCVVATEAIGPTKPKLFTL